MTTRTATILAIVGGVVMVVGSFLPWISARTGLGSLDIAGTDGDGVFSLGLGALIALIALVHLDRPASAPIRFVIVGAALIGTLIGVIDYISLTDRIAGLTSNLITASIGAGVYVLFIGCLAAIIGGSNMRRPAATST